MKQAYQQPKRYVIKRRVTRHTHTHAYIYIYIHGYAHTHTHGYTLTVIDLSEMIYKVRYAC